MYTAALRELPAYASSIVQPAATPGCSSGAIEVADDTGLRAAVASGDDSVICVTTSFTLTSALSIDDTTVTIEGSSPAVTLTAAAGDRLIHAHFTDAASDDSLILKNITLTGGRATASPGAGIRVVSDDTTSDDGLVLDGVTLTDHGVTTNGGAAYARNLDTLSIIDSTISDNRGFDSAGPQFGSAGGIEARVVDTVTIENSTFDRNESTRQFQYNGGAIFILDAKDVSVTDSQFTGNESYAEGSAMSIESADDLDDTLSIRDSTFSGNVANAPNNLGAGALAVYNTGEVGISDSHFTGNTAFRGGAIYAKGDFGGPGSPSIAIVGSTINDNEAAQDGGGIFVGAANDVVISETSITGNSLTGAGGVPIYGGGGINIGGAVSLTVAVSSITGNSAGTTGFGGGLSGYVYLNSYILYSTIAGNAAGYGAGISLYKDSSLAGLSRISNSTISDNTAAISGGGMGLAGGPHALLFGTIFGNSAPRGGGIDMDDSTTINVYGSIIAGNSGNSGADVFVADDTTVLTSQYSIFGSSATISGATVSDDSNIFGNPKLNTLADNGGPTLTRLPQWDSPVIGAADPLWSGTPPYDQRGLGFPRNAGGAVSMGAVQGSSAPPPPAPIPAGPPREVAAIARDASATVTWSPPASSGSFPVTTYQAVVSPGGQSCLSSSSPCTITGLTNGVEYTVAVRALNGAGWGAFSSPSAPFTPEAPVQESIVITGTRGEVRGRPGVIVDGVTTGLVGAQVAPWVKFPGQTSYTQGSARRTVDAQGDFTWQRRTNKKVYVYFRTTEGDVRSNRIIIRRS